MKKIIHVFMAILCALGLTMQGTNMIAYAAEQYVLHVETPYGVTLDPNYKWAVGMTEYSNQGYNVDVYAQLTINGQKVYCIDPLRNTIDGAGDYSASALGEYTGNAELNQKLGYINALGYGYNGDTSDEMDFATQIRIWQEMRPGLITNIHPDIQAKIDQINQRLNVMYSDVSFAGSTVTLQGYGKEHAQTLEDTAGLFSKYLDSSVSGIHTERNGNALTIWAEKGDSLNTTLSYDALYAYAEPISQIAYTSPTSQNVGYLGTPSSKQIQVQVKLELGSVQLVKEDFETAGTPQGEATLEGAEYQLVDDVTQEVVGTLTTDAQGNSNVISDLPTDRTYTIVEIKAPNGYKLSAEKAQVDFSSLQAVNNIKFYTGAMRDHVITGSFEIRKVITDGQESEITKPEQGAEFIAVLKKYVDQYGSVESAYEHHEEFADREYDHLITDEDGHARSKDLAFGTYIVKQIKGQIDTDKLEAEWTFVVSEEDQDPITYVINNRPFTSYLKVVKLDKESGKEITATGITFKILNTDTDEYVSQKVGDKHVDEWTTDEDGAVVLDQPLKAGNYRLVEIKAPEGFIKTEDIDFTITNSVVSETDPDGDPIQIISVSDEQAKGKVTLTKTDKETGEAMADVEYQLTAKEDILDPVDGSVLYETGEVVSQGKTDTDGKMVLDDLPLGHYELKETLTQEGYVLSEQVHDVHLKQKDDTTKEYVVDLNITNIKPVGRIHVLKTDQDTEQPLGGITFQLTAKEDIYSLDGRNTLLYEAGQPVSVDISENGQYVTNELGEVFIGDLPLGKYELKEIQTLDGYYSNAEVYEIDLSYDGSDKTVYLEELNITNEKTKVDISKVDATTGKEIEGAHMSLTDKETGEVIEEWVSAKEPHRIEGLSVGKTYILHEDIAPAGYELAQDVEFTIEDTGEVQKVVMEDELTPVTPDTPHTGSKTDLKMYAALAGLSGIVITLIYMGRKKKSKK
ncbi:MAG TPA: Cys-Gln thioester bond-forming surface protein [Candidatus Merdibacter merdavium]|uniref:Cys-Gln thioester bond-forming surface protein n=1 Tax=Candidatus Merdibacter merdavium TaxID=2838692 RepID=A0A9D2NSE8_9FIRM|nr:Cys-Gln thioester bond-forming surface protein [Candidatus Merdibacter merdavium]